MKKRLGTGKTIGRGKPGSMDKALEYDEGNPIDLSTKPAWGQPGPGEATPDRTNYDERPRTMEIQKANFSAKNPEFQNIAHEGDWTSAKWSHNV